jgi:hypothetical protein
MKNGILGKKGFVGSAINQKQKWRMSTQLGSS